MSKFKKLSDAVAKEYEKKGDSKKAAQRIGGAVAAKVGREKLGEKKMELLSKKGREDSKGLRR